MPERHLIVVADDFGLSLGVSRAIIETHRHGIVTATSVLANAPATLASLPLLAEHPTLAVGLHGALVGEDPPVCAARDVPTLVDRRGRLAASWTALLPRLLLGRVDPADVTRELRAQLDVVASGGVPVTFLNLHQHLQLWPSLQPVLLELAAAAELGYVRTPRGERGPVALGVGPLADRLADRLAGAGVRTSDGYLGLDQAGTWNGSTLRAALAAVPGRVVEVNVHPGPHGGPDLQRYPWGYAWGDERDALIDGRTRRAVAEAGFTLVTPSAVPARAS